MYLLQVINNVHLGSSTGIVNRYVSHYEAETIKPLMIKCNRILQEKSNNCFLNFHFYKLSRDYVTEIKNGSFDFQKLETLEELLYFHSSGLNCEE